MGICIMMGSRTDKYRMEKIKSLESDFRDAVIKAERSHGEMEKAKHESDAYIAKINSSLIDVDKVKTIDGVRASSHSNEIIYQKAISNQSKALNLAISNIEYERKAEQFAMQQRNEWEKLAKANQSFARIQGIGIGTAIGVIVASVLYFSIKH